MRSEEDDKRPVVEASFVPDVAPSPPIPPPMTAKDFKRHCAKVAGDKSKGMATRLAAFGLGTVTEMFLDATGEVLGTAKRSSKKRLKK